MQKAVKRSIPGRNPEMELQFSCRNWGTIYTGSGCTRNLNSSEVTFDSDRDLPEGADIVIQVQWPFLLQSVCPLELVIRGSIIRTFGRKIVVHIDKYEFRTRGEQSFEAPIAKGMTCDFTA